jgi:hypothetical protein
LQDSSLTPLAVCGVEGRVIRIMSAHALLGDKRPPRKNADSHRRGAIPQPWERHRSSTPPPLPASKCTPPTIDCSTDGDPYPPSICEPPSSPSPPWHPPLLPLGASERRPQVELCIIPRSEEITTVEEALDLTLWR